jgi:hypothetical protein
MHSLVIIESASFSSWLSVNANRNNRRPSTQNDEQFQASKLQLPWNLCTQ